MWTLHFIVCIPLTIITFKKKREVFLSTFFLVSAHFPVLIIINTWWRSDGNQLNTLGPLYCFFELCETKSSAVLTNKSGSRVEIWLRVKTGLIAVTCRLESVYKGFVCLFSIDASLFFVFAIVINRWSLKGELPLNDLSTQGWMNYLISVSQYVVIYKRNPKLNITCICLLWRISKASRWLYLHSTSTHAVFVRGSLNVVSLPFQMSHACLEIHSNFPNCKHPLASHLPSLCSVSITQLYIGDTKRLC